MIIVFVQRLYRVVDSLRVIDFTAPLLMRILLIPIFWMAGTNKLMNIEGTASFFGRLGIPLPELMAWVAGLTEAGGAVLLALGLGVRLIAIPLSVTMVVAATTAHWENGWLAIASGSDEGIRQRLDVARSVLQEHADYGWLTAKGRFVILNNGIQFAAIYLIMCLSLFFTGAGRILSLDYWLQRYFVNYRAVPDFPEDENYTS